MLLCLCLLLAGCGGNNGGKDNSSNNSSSNNSSNSNDNDSSAADSKLSGHLEVGILLAEGTTGYNLIVENVGDALIAENPDLEIEHTFANSKARSFMEQRWRSNDAPDTDYFVFNAQVPSTYEFTDYLLDLTPYLAEDGWGDSFSEASKAVTTMDGKTYGVVTDCHILGLYYNKAYFDQFGINPPETFEDLVAACETLKSNGIDPIAVTGTYAPYMGSWLDHLMMRQAGYDAAKEAIYSGTISENADLMTAIDNVKILIDNGYFLSGFEGTDFTAAQMQFFQGKAGMILMGTWLTSEMADSIPEDFQLGFCPFPSVAGGKGDLGETLSHNNIMCINKDSENLEAALAYVKRLTSAEVQTKRAQETGLISAVSGVPAPEGVFGLNEAVAAAGSLKVRHYGLEYDADANTAYYNEVAKLFMGEYKTAAEFAAGADAAMQALS